MDLIIPFTSIIGVIVGFLLSTLKEWIQNKPKIKIDLKTGEFNYYRKYENELGETVTRKTTPTYSDFYKVNLQLDIYNYGKGNTAIKSINVENIINRKCLVYSTSTVNLKVNNLSVSSFNLPASNIVTVELEWRVDKEEYTALLFDEETLLPESEGLKFKIVAQSIKNKKYNLKVEPISILTAF